MLKIKKLLLVLLLLFSGLLLACKPKEKVDDKLYHLTYILNGQEYSNVEVKSSDEIVLEEIEERNGIVFLGWFEDANYTIPFKNKTISSDTTIYGKYIEGYYRVTFYTDCDTEIPQMIVAKGTILENIPTLLKDGYEFLGWYRDEKGLTPFRIDIEPVNSKLNLYAKWKIEEEKILHINFRSLNEGIWASKDDIYIDYYTYFYNFLKEHTSCDLSRTSLEDFLRDGKTWAINGKSDMYHFGDRYGRYYLKSMKGGTLAEQPESTFLGYCYKNGKFIDLINHLEEFFAYWRTDEGYTGSESDPNNEGNDFYVEPWASMVDTAKFFFFTSETLNTKYSWFDSERVKYALDHIPNVLIGLENYNVLLGEELDLSDARVEGYHLTFYLDKEQTIEINKLNEAQTSCDECDSIDVYVKIEKEGN